MPRATLLLFFACAAFLFLVAPVNGQEVQATRHAAEFREREARPIAEPDPQPLDFVSASEQLTDVEDLFSGGNGQAVAFDSVRAIERGSDPATVKLAEELAAFTNDLIHAADRFVAGESLDPMTAVSPEKYAMVSRFFRAATAFERRQMEESQDSGSRGVQTEGWCRWYLTDAACTCGHWLYPVPTSAVSAKKYVVANPTSTLKSWGYHQTPSWAGGAWTRAQTYYPSRCGYGTYRDHAWFGSDNKSVWEQNYAGRTPRGEPNPEFWTSAVWAYPAWPTYVYWWHQTY